MKEMIQMNQCTNEEAHEAHMALNGECPWCGEYDAEAELLTIKEMNDTYGVNLPEEG